MIDDTKKGRAPQNRTISVSHTERQVLRSNLFHTSDACGNITVLDKTIHADVLDGVKLIPTASIDLLILDPPYNLNKQFNGTRFRKCNLPEYSAWMRT